MRRFIALFAVVILVIGCAAPVLAAGLGISPPSVEFDVPADGSTEVEFLVYDFTGDLDISLEDIPLRVEPTTVPVTASAEGTRVVLTFYGDESLGSKIYQGKIRFLAMTGGMVAMGIKVRATVTNSVDGETPVLATPEESQPPASQEPEEESIPEEEASEETTTEESPEQASEETTTEVTSPTPEEQAPTGESEEQSSSTPEEQAPTGESEEQSSLTPGSSSFPILPVAGIAAGTIIIITLIVVIARRYRY